MAVHSPRKKNIFPCGKSSVKAAAYLDKRCDSAPYLDSASRGSDYACDSFEQGRFTGAVPAYKGKRVALFYLQVYISERPEFVIAELALDKIDKVFLYALFAVFAEVEHNRNIIDINADILADLTRRCNNAL